MLILIIVTCLVTVVVIILSLTLYLFSLISEWSDDEDYVDALSIQADDFNASPAVSPAKSANSRELCDNSTHHHRCQQRDKPTSVGRTSSNDIAGKESSYSNRPGSTRAQGISQVYGASNDRDTTSKQLHWSNMTQAEKSLIANQLGVPVSRQLFDEFDQKEMASGGSGLHWCKTRKALDKLIRLGVPLDMLNSNHETALHVAVRKRKLAVLIGLLCHGAGVDGRNGKGETPLITASKVNDMFAVQLLLVFDADVNASDYEGFTARHYAAGICEKRKAQTQLPSAAHLILAMLNEMGAQRCPDAGDSATKGGGGKNSNSGPTKGAKCTDGCSSSGTYNGNSYNRWPKLKKESLYKRNMFSDLIEASKQRKWLKTNRDDNGYEPYFRNEIKRSRLLCIDGGGLRGIIPVQLMIELEKYLKNPIISYFDWIGGTSVGAFIACALCTGTSLQHLRRICFNVKDEVFSGTKPYNSTNLERVLKRTLGPKTRMSACDPKTRKLAVTTVLANREPCQLRFFRNYPSVDQMLEKHGFSADTFNSISSLASTKTATKSSEDVASKSSGKPMPQNKQGTDVKDEDVPDEDDQDPYMWQAARASAAAPFFFKPYGPYLDGGLISNCPTIDCLCEFFQYESAKSFLRARKADCKEPEGLGLDILNEPPSKADLVVSLGTGRGRVVEKRALVDFGHIAANFSTVFSPVELVRSIRAVRDLFRKLMQQACHTEDHILDRAQAWCASLDIPYFRINPPLSTIFSIDDKRDEQLINALWQTKLYMRQVRPQLEELRELLDGQ